MDDNFDGAGLADDSGRWVHESLQPEDLEILADKIP